MTFATPSCGPLRVAPHPHLFATAFVTRYASPMGEQATPPPLLGLLSLDANAPITRDEAVRETIRALLRYGGYKPTGRGKPASEYLVRAVGEGALGSINRAVDACNVVSLHSGLPISVIDLDRAIAPLSIGLAPAGTNYVFNTGGQEIAVGGLLCVFDHEGPCAGPVKDSQRTKTSASTTRTLSVVWGARGLEDRTTRATAWYRTLVEETGAITEDVELEFSGSVTDGP